MHNYMNSFTAVKIHRAQLYFFSISQAHTFPDQPARLLPSPCGRFKTRFRGNATGLDLLAQEARVGPRRKGYLIKLSHPEGVRTVSFV